MAFNTIPELWTRVGKPITVGLMNRIRTNLDDLNSRIDTISISAGSKEVFNDLVEADDSIPIGLTLSTADDVEPSGFLFCYGQAISRAAYPELFAKIGTLYGVGDGSTTFNLPDLRGRTVVGKDNMGGTAANRITTAGSGINGSSLGVAAAGGSQSVATHTHTMAHTHNVTHNHSMSHTHNIAHTHKVARVPSIGGPLRMYNSSTVGDTSDPTTDVLVTFADSHSGSDFKPVLNATANTYHTSGVSGNANTGTGSNAMSGGSSSSVTGSASISDTGPASVSISSSTLGSVQTHANVQPSIIQNYMIRALNVIDTNTRQIVKRINQSVRINNVVVTPVEQGTSGTLEIDIKKGTSVAGATQTIFSTTPTLAWDATDPQTGTTDVDQNVVSVGSYIVISIETTQANLKAFHLLVTGDL